MATRARTWEKNNPEAVREMNRRIIARKRAWLNELKNRPCKDCRHKFPPECMDWDHIRGKKLFCIGYADVQHISRERILAEIKKCELVCANCHRIRTTRRARRGNRKRKG